MPNLIFNVLLQNYVNPTICIVMDCHYLANSLWILLNLALSSGYLQSVLFIRKKKDVSPCRCDPQTSAECPVAAGSCLHHVTLQRCHQWPTRLVPRARSHLQPCLQNRRGCGIQLQIRGPTYRGKNRSWQSNNPFFNKKNIAQHVTARDMAVGWRIWRQPVARIQIATVKYHLIFTRSE